jgi:hypothetical protein
MSRKSRSIVAFFLLMLLGAGIAYSQPHGHRNKGGGFEKFKKRKQYWSVGGSINAMNYVGDLDPAQNYFSPALRYTKPNFAFSASFRYNKRITYRATLSWGRIMGNDIISGQGGDAQFRRMRNANFRNSITEIKLDVVYDFIIHPHDYTKRPNTVIPYVFGGLAGFYHNPKALHNGKWVALQPLETEGESYSKYQVALPFGVGVRLRLSSNLDLSFEIGWRKTFTGYLDDVNKDYVNPKDQSPQSLELSNTSVDWINQPERPSQYANADYATLSQFIKEGAPDIAYERIYYNRRTDRLEFIGWGRAGDQRGHQKGRSDWYIVTGFNLSYIIGGRLVCPKYKDTRKKRFFLQ